METKINVSELKLKTVNFNWFFNYLTINLNWDSDSFEFSDFYNLFKNIKNNKYKNISANFNDIKNESDLINFCYKYYNKSTEILTLIYNREKILINIDTVNESCISLIINKFNKNYNMYEFINDYLDYEAEMLNNE